MERWHYRYSGLRVVTELQIPEWSSFEQTSTEGDPDVLICLEKRRSHEPDPREHPSVISTDEYYFIVPDIGCYRVLNGRKIIVTPLPEAGLSELRLFLLGSAWGALCYQRGLLVFHAAVAQVGDGVVAFCGTAGMGKSSITAWLASRGRTLVSDDLCRFDIPDHGEPIVYPSAPRHKLWHDALSALGISCEDLQRDHFRFDKFHLPWSGKPSLQPLPLHGIYLLEWGELGIKRLSGREAISNFMTAATYRGDLLEPMGQVGGYWRSCLELLNRVSVWELKRPRDLSVMDKTVKLLEDHWVEIGLDASANI